MLKSIYSFRENASLLNIDADDIHGGRLVDFQRSRPFRSFLQLKFYKDSVVMSRLTPQTMCSCPGYNLLEPLQQDQHVSNFHSKITFSLLWNDQPQNSNIHLSTTILHTLHVTDASSEKVKIKHISKHRTKKMKVY